MKTSMRKSIESDLEVFFLNQADPEANHMAAFTSKDPYDKNAYISKWQRLISDDTINMQTIVLGEQAIGCVVKFMMEGEAEITYAIGKEYWGKGLTTNAVKQFLEIESTRPINGRVAYDNIASQRILEKAGFSRIGKETSFANARGKEIDEFIYRIED